MCLQVQSQFGCFTLSVKAFMLLIAKRFFLVQQYISWTPFTYMYTKPVLFVLYYTCTCGHGCTTVFLWSCFLIIRVVQKNLVFVIGLSPRLADPEVSWFEYWCCFFVRFYLFLKKSITKWLKLSTTCKCTCSLMCVHVYMYMYIYMYTVYIHVGCFTNKRCMHTVHVCVVLICFVYSVLFH